MADRSDDIKQLFAHLGLNPADYQEIKPAVSVSRISVPPAVAPAVPPPLPVIAKPHESKTSAFPPLTPSPAMAAATVPGLRELMAQAVPAAARQPSAPPRVIEKPSAPARRWALLDAVVSNPPGVLSRVVPLRQAPPPSGVPVAMQGEFKPTASSVSTQRPHYLQAADPDLSRPARPLITELQKAPGNPRERANVDEATRIISSPAKTPAAASGVQKQAAAAPGSVALSDAFRRLVHPVAPASTVSGRLRFNYTARAGAAFSQKPAANELLGDVFNRIAGQTAHRAHQ